MRCVVLSIVFPLALVLASPPSQAAVRCPRGSEKKETLTKDGKPNVAFCMREGKLHGPMERFHSTGKLMLKATFKDGLAEGRYQEWYPDGRRYLQGAYLQGKHHGKWSWWDAKGKILATVKLDKGTGPFVEIDRKAGVKRAEGQMVDGRKDGQWRTFYAGGKVESKKKYKAGRLHGTVEYFHPNGATLSKEAYADGQSHGVAEQWNDAGVRTRRQALKGDAKHGRQLAWYDDGTFKHAACYVAGKMKWDVANSEGGASVVYRADAVEFARKRARGLARKCP